MAWFGLQDDDDDGAIRGATHPRPTHHRGTGAGNSGDAVRGDGDGDDVAGNETGTAAGHVRADAAADDQDEDGAGEKNDGAGQDEDATGEDEDGAAPDPWPTRMTEPAAPWQATASTPAPAPVSARLSHLPWRGRRRQRR